MNRTPVLAVALATLSVKLAGCVLGNCAAVCPDPFMLTFVDESGNAVSDVSGTVTQAPGAPESFDCVSAAGRSDAGTPLTCTGNTVIAYSYSDHRPVTVSVRSASGKQFVGSVTPTYSPSQSRVCGSTCSAGAATVTLR